MRVCWCVRAYLDGLNVDHKFRVGLLIVNRQENALTGWIHADKLCESVVSLKGESVHCFRLWS